MTYIQKLQSRKLLITIDTPVSSHLEITEIADRVSKQPHGGKALLFTNIEGSKYPLLINALGSYQRIELGLGATPDAIGERIHKLITIKRYATLMGKVKAIPSLLSLAFSFPLRLPRRIFLKKPPCQQVIEEPDLNKLPVLHCWPEDGGQFFTLPLVFTRDPDTGRQNVGMYRMQVYDKKTTGMHWHLHKDGREIFEAYRRRGESMPVSVVLSCDPKLIYAAISPMPNFIDEMAFAGFLQKHPVPMVKCITNDIYVPRNAEFVLEGEVPLDEFRTEGPFGDHTGYYSLQDQYPVFKIKKITRKKQPLYPATIVGQPPMEDCYLGKATERIFLPLLHMLVPEVVDIDLPLEGVFHNCAIVSMHKRFVAHGTKTLNALWGSGQMMYTKMIILVDSDVNPHDYRAVLQAVLNYGLQNKKNLIISHGPLDALDHASPHAFQGHRLGIDATKKLPQEYGAQWINTPMKPLPTVNSVEINGAPHGKSGELLQHICAQFPAVVALGKLPDFWSAILPVVVDTTAIQETPAPYYKRLHRWLVDHASPRIIILIDPSVDANNPSEVLWKLFNNIDAQRDMYYLAGESPSGAGFSADTGASHAGGAGVADGINPAGGVSPAPSVLFDATKKGKLNDHHRLWPHDIVMSKEIQAVVDSKWDQYDID